jgi:rsbT co-antagonist protein RsbR
MVGSLAVLTTHTTMLVWVAASRPALEQNTLAALREHMTDNSGTLAPFQLPTVATEIIVQMLRFLSAADACAETFGVELAGRGLGLRSWLAVGRALTRDFVAQACGPAAVSGQQADAVDVLARLQLFVTEVVEGLARAEMAAISSQRDEMNAALEHVIEARESHLRGFIQQLSTPVMPVHRKILVLPLIGAIDDERARRITERVLAETSQRQARIVIIDVTGLAHCDAGVIASLTSVVRAVQLLGARAVLVGIQPELARTMAGFDLDRTLVTLADLQSAIEWALRELGLAIVPRAAAAAQAGHMHDKQASERHDD